MLSAVAVRLSRGKMWRLSVILMVLTAFVSAWLDNVTTMLLMVPVTISVMRQCNADPVPLMLAQALMSNIGGAATMVGDPPALIIGTALSNYIGFIDFIINMAPGVIMAAVACVPLILWLFRKTLLGPIQKYDEILEEVQAFRITDWDLFAKCSYVTGAVLIGKPSRCSVWASGLLPCGDITMPASPQSGKKLCTCMGKPSPSWRPEPLTLRAYWFTCSLRDTYTSLSGPWHVTS